MRSRQSPTRGVVSKFGETHLVFGEPFDLQLGLALYGGKNRLVVLLVQVQRHLVFIVSLEDEPVLFPFMKKRGAANTLATTATAIPALQRRCSEKEYWAVLILW